MGSRCVGLVIALVAWATPGQADPEPSPWVDSNAPGAIAPAPPPAEASPLIVRELQVHGFVSEGGFVSTDNDYIGASSRGSLELFEAGLDVSTEVADRLRAGIQLFARDEGTFHDDAPRIDWAFLDYRYRSWLGLRAGQTRLPFGLYNEYSDIDASRIPLLLPQGIYPLRNREALLAQRGFLLYGEASGFEYQAWLGTLSIPSNAIVVQGAALDRIDTKYVTGAQVFWHAPIDGLRIGGSYLRASIDFHASVDAITAGALIMAGLAPADFTGALVVSQRPTQQWIGSAELVRGPWQLAAEYARTTTRQRSSLPLAIPTAETTGDAMYAMAGYQATPRFAGSLYYSVGFADVDDRRGHDPKYVESFQAWSRDLAATLRFDVNDHWLWKLEGHFVDGAGGLDSTMNPTPERYWGLFLLRTTVTF